MQATLHTELARIAAETTAGGFGHVMYTAVFAGWLIALLAWLLGATHATGAQIVLIWLCTAPIGALHFRHSIAGSVEAFYYAAAGDAGWGRMLTDFVLPSVLGNTIGGVLLVALLNHGQVVAEKAAQSEAAPAHEREPNRRRGERRAHSPARMPT